MSIIERRSEAYNLLVSISPRDVPVEAAATAPTTSRVTLLQSEPSQSSLPVECDAVIYKWQAHTPPDIMQARVCLGKN
jgi:hypothetical protein